MAATGSWSRKYLTIVLVPLQEHQKHIYGLFGRFIWSAVLKSLKY